MAVGVSGLVSDISQATAAIMGTRVGLFESVWDTTGQSMAIGVLGKYFGAAPLPLSLSNFVCPTFVIYQYVPSFECLCSLCVVW